MTEESPTPTPAVQPTAPSADEPLLQRYPVIAYFGLTFTISWTGAFLVAAPHLLRGESLPQLTGILMFPAMLLGPSGAGIIMTRMLDGRAGVRDLVSHMGRIHFPARWYAALLIPTALIFTVLMSLKALVSPVYAQNFFPVGLAFGIPAGFLEEIGWMGFAYPKMRQRFSGFAAAVLLGCLWSMWHLPVIDFLGTATPHRASWLPYFAAFAAAMTAMRVLIAWLYSNTGSLLLCQLMHVCSTGSLVLFSPVRVSAAQEAFWYVVYAAALWLLVGLLSRFGMAFPCPEKTPRVG